MIHSKTPKTAAVLVKRRDPHPLYRKLVVKSKRYQVHDPDQQCVAGDKILFEKSRPFSKTKHWIFRATLAQDSASRFLLDNPDVAAKTEKSERKARSEQMAASGRV